MSTDRRSSVSAASPEENAMFLDIVQETSVPGHKKPTRIYGSIAYCLLLAGYVVLAVGAPWIFKEMKHLIPTLLCCCDVALLFITGVFQQYLVYQVQKIRLQGYYSFSQKLKHVVRLPFAITAYGTAAMLLFIMWEPSFLSIDWILRIIMVIEAVCAGSFMCVYLSKFVQLCVVRSPDLLGCYIVLNFALTIPIWFNLLFGSIPISGYVHQYNSLNFQPDVLKSLYSPLQQNSPLEGVRYYDGGQLSDQQMALLQYQRENLHFLNEEVLRLRECVSKYERTNDGSTPQVDLDHLLAARDQELRTLSAEMDQLQSELRLARSLIAERDSELQSIRITNKKYVEENERLRAILGEWSARAAKLERALEAERIRSLNLPKTIPSSSGQWHASAPSPDQQGS